jgi:hypothetical protein
MRKGGRSLGPSEDGSWLEGRATRMNDGRFVLGSVVIAAYGAKLALPEAIVR